MITKLKKRPGPNKRAVEPLVNEWKVKLFYAKLIKHFAIKAYGGVDV
jgi:hypothetical protein